MSRPLVLSENLQVRLPEGSKAQMRRFLPADETLGGFWRERMLLWLDDTERRGKGEARDEANNPHTR